MSAVLPLALNHSPTFSRSALRLRISIGSASAFSASLLAFFFFRNSPLFPFVSPTSAHSSSAGIFPARRILSFCSTMSFIVNIICPSFPLASVLPSFSFAATVSPGSVARPSGPQIIVQFPRSRLTLASLPLPSSSCILLVIRKSLLIRLSGISFPIHPSISLNLFSPSLASYSHVQHLQLHTIFRGGNTAAIFSLHFLCIGCTFMSISILIPYFLLSSLLAAGGMYSSFSPAFCSTFGIMCPTSASSIGTFSPQPPKWIPHNPPSLSQILSNCFLRLPICPPLHFLHYVHAISPTASIDVAIAVATALHAIILAYLSSLLPSGGFTWWLLLRSGERLLRIRPADVTVLVFGYIWLMALSMVVSISCHGITMDSPTS